MAWDDTKQNGQTLTGPEYNAMVADQKARIPSTEKAAANGVATLDATGNVPANQLGNVEGMEQHGDEWHSVEYVKEGDRRLSTGINWTIRNSAADNQWFSVCYGNGLFVAVAYSGTDNRVMTSGYTLENVIPLPKQISAIPKTVRFDGILAAGNAQQFSALEVDATLQTVRAVLRGSLPVGASILVQVTKNGADTLDSVLTADIPIEITTTAVALANGLYVVEGSIDAGMAACSAYDWFQATIVQTGTDYAGNDLDVQLVFG